MIQNLLKHLSLNLQTSCWGVPLVCGDNTASCEESPVATAARKTGQTECAFQSKRLGLKKQVSGFHLRPLMGEKKWASIWE